jgi:hypothetical protein
MVPPGMNFASVICVGATGKPVRVASLAQAAAGSGGVAARLADTPKLAADTLTKSDLTTETGSCRGRRCFMSSLPCAAASVLSLTEDSQIGANLRIFADEEDRANFDQRG